MRKVKQMVLAMTLAGVIFLENISISLAEEVSEIPLIQEEDTVIGETEPEEEVQESNLVEEEGEFSSEDNNEKQPSGETILDREDVIQEEIGSNLQEEEDTEIMDAQTGQWNEIVLDASFDGKHFAYGETVVIPYSMHSYGIYGQTYGVDIYNWRNEKVDSVELKCPEDEFEEESIFYGGEVYIPGSYYVQAYIYADQIKTEMGQPFKFYVDDDPSMHFFRTTDSFQTSIIDNLKSPISAWKRVAGKIRRDWTGDRTDKTTYEVQLEEMYTGELAAGIAEDESHNNTSPGNDRQWFIMKFWFKNTSSRRIWAGNIIHQNYFRTNTGAEMHIGTAAFTKDRDGQSVYDLYLEPGEEGYGWFGVLIPKEVGAPYIRLQTEPSRPGKYNEDDTAMWLNTDPYAQDASGSWPFDDVPVAIGAWRYEAVKYVYNHGIMNGIFGTRNFAPDDPLTRAMFATMIYRMEGSPKASYSAKFPDVPDGNYFSVPILWANKVGIINGHSNTGLFGTRENITREDMVVIMYCYCKYKGIAANERADLSSFPDAGEVSGYAKEAVQWAVANGIIKGRSNTGMLDPKGSASRVETAAVIQRFMNHIGK